MNEERRLLIYRLICSFLWFKQLTKATTVGSNKTQVQIKYFSPLIKTAGFPVVRVEGSPFYVNVQISLLTNGIVQFDTES